ncbi:MAG: Acyl-CoA synthetase (NDP forming) [Chloroflexi bacterium]|nr:MAG: Acyl-CoA synthetase (NDP forming) [Chloroflexota bacterium]
MLPPDPEQETRVANHPLDPIFHPRAVAVVGASSRPGGANFVSALIEQGCETIYPVNPNADEILGLPVFPNLGAIPGPVDHVISSIPADRVEPMLEDAGAKGVRSMHFFTAGFAETGESDRLALQQRIVHRAKELNIRVFGPNCLGLYVPGSGLAFASGCPTDAGPVAFWAQSGTNANTVIYDGALRGLRFSKVVSFGNAVDVNAAELCRYALADPQTEFVGAYIEGLPDARDLFQALRELAAEKPVALLKGGMTDAGARSTRSHTASLAGSGAIWRAAATQANAVLVGSMQESIDMLVGWRFGAVPQGERVALVVGGGGLSVQGSDDIASLGLTLPDLTVATAERLRELTPIAGTSIRNPVDTQSLWRGDDLAPTLETIAADDNLDALIVQIGTSWGGAMDPGFAQKRQDRLFRELQQATPRLAKIGKPVALVIPTSHDPFTAQLSGGLLQRVIALGYPTFTSVPAAARTLQRLNTWRRRRAERAPG